MKMIYKGKRWRLARNHYITRYHFMWDKKVFKFWKFILVRIKQ